ncbi:hypothetical protein TcasGA2_TC001190, partial [Tribolium castaneum]
TRLYQQFCVFRKADVWGTGARPVEGVIIWLFFRKSSCYVSSLDGSLLRQRTKSINGTIKGCINMHKIKTIRPTPSVGTDTAQIRKIGSSEPRLYPTISGHCGR